MPALNNTRVLLANRPVNRRVLESDFKVETVDAPEPGEGQVLLRTLWLSLDPYMRGRMSAAKSYAKPVEVGDAMVGATVSRVTTSRHAGYAQGDIVLGHVGWQDYGLSDGKGLRKL